MPPLPGYRVIHPQFEAHHRPVAENVQTATATITRHTAAGATFDPDNGQTTYPTATTVYSGRCRVQRPMQGEMAREIGDRQVIIRPHVVSLPADAPEVRIGDKVTVSPWSDSTQGDPHLPGEPLWVHDVRYGSLIWQRDLVCLNAPPTAR